MSRYDAIGPAGWRFVVGDHGCPSIAPEQNHGDLRFNLSHTMGLIVCAVTRGRDIGVDVEYEPRKSQTTKIADRFFAPPEVAALHRLPEAQQRERFFAYWTLKEAYIKGRGMGLAIPLKRFWFDVDTPGLIEFQNDPSLQDDPKSWSFVRLMASPDHPL
ncbi:MAG: 4'-phosphopantetheinyl transferase superfamily protein, partial [Myxococcota bacterium]|nr:4'-phosphopantetheinyl transferase superfamily protein [Myxococcota bacterium]